MRGGHSRSRVLKGALEVLLIATARAAGRVSGKEEGLMENRPTG